MPGNFVKDFSTKQFRRRLFSGDGDFSEGITGIREPQYLACSKCPEESNGTDPLTLEPELLQILMNLMKVKSLAIMTELYLCTLER